MAGGEPGQASKLLHSLKARISNRARGNFHPVPGLGSTFMGVQGTFRGSSECHRLILMNPCGKRSNILIQGAA